MGEIRYLGFKLSIWKIILLVGDICVLCISLSAGLFLSPRIYDPLPLFYESKVSFLFMGIVYLLVNFIGDLYDYQKDYRGWKNIAEVSITAIVGAIANIILFYFPLGKFVGRFFLIIQATSYGMLLPLWRFTFSSLALPVRLQRRLLIVGAGRSGTRLLQAIRNRSLCGMEAKGFIDDDPEKIGTEINGLPVLGNSLQLSELVSQYKIDLVVVAITHEKSPQLINILTKVSWSGIEVIDMPNLYEQLAEKLPIDHLSDVWLLFNSLNKNKLYCKHLKRIIDVVVSGALMLTHAPLFAIIALAIKLDSRGPVFYRQSRLGYEGRSFQLIKFRTMIEHAEANGPQWTTDNDDRITRVGYYLRKFRLDELPQLINVLKGEMSIVGPRPEREIFINEFQELIATRRPGRRATDPPGTMISAGLREKIPYYSNRLLVKPGITGWAQVMYPYASSLEQTKEKLEYDLFYVKNIGFFLDMAIILKTVRIVLFGRGM